MVLDIDEPFAVENKTERRLPQRCKESDGSEKGLVDYRNPKLIHFEPHDRNTFFLLRRHSHSLQKTVFIVF